MNTQNLHERLIIIGSGPAALTAAIYTGRAHLKPLVFEGETPGGQLMSTTLVENWPGKVSIMGPELMMNMRKQAQEFGTRFLFETVTQVDFSEKPFKLSTSKNKTFTADAIIIATGANPKRLNCPGEQAYWAKGVSTCAVCDGALYKDKKVVIIGGGDTAMEDASFMTHFTQDVTIIQLLDKLTASMPMQERVLKNPKVKIIYCASVQEFVGDNNRLTGIKVEYTDSKKTEIIPADAAFLAVGLIPNTGIFKDKLELTPSGHIVQKKDTQTSVPGVFSAGDVSDSRYRQAITSAGSGCMAALDAERYLSSL
jgi:thioredoxin reductase (NADPH)